MNQVCTNLGKADGWVIQLWGKTEARLSVMLSQINGTILGCEECLEYLLDRYVSGPGNMPDTCDGFGVKKTLQNSLTCKVLEIIHTQHNEMMGVLSHHYHLSQYPYKFHNK